MLQSLLITSVHVVRFCSIIIFVIRVRTGPIPGSGPAGPRPDRSRIFFWTGADPCAAFLTDYVHCVES